MRAQGRAGQIRNGREQGSDDPRSPRACQCKSLINQALHLRKAAPLRPLTARPVQPCGSELARGRAATRPQFAGKPAPTRAARAQRTAQTMTPRLDDPAADPLYSRALLVM